MIKQLFKGTILSILIFFSISFLTVLFQINSPLNRIETISELRIGFPFQYYYQFTVDCPDLLYSWNIVNLVLDFGLIWILTIGIMMFLKKQKSTIIK